MLPDCSLNAQVATAVAVRIAMESIPPQQPHRVTLGDVTNAPQPSDPTSLQLHQYTQKVVRKIKELARPEGEDENTELLNIAKNAMISVLSGENGEESNKPIVNWFKMNYKENPSADDLAMNAEEMIEDLTYYMNM